MNVSKPRLSARLLAGAARSACAPALALALASVFCPLAGASETTAWEMNSYGDFIRGGFHGVSLTRDGRLSIAPRMDSLFNSDQAVIWSVAAAPDGTLYAATGHRGRVYKIDRAGKASLLWTADQPEVFAVAVDRGGAVFAATSPNGAVYKIDAAGKAVRYFAPGSSYIWSLAAAPDGSLYVGTGNQGKIFRVDPQGKGEVYYDTDQGHVTGLALDSQGRLLAGTEPNGILYRISAKDKGFVLYDAGLPEIRAIVPMPDGTVYAAAMGGSVAKREQAATQAGGAGAGSGMPTFTTSITVEAAQTSEVKPPDPSRQQVQQPVPQTSPAQATTSVSQSAAEVAGVEKSAIYKINPDNTVETLWSSKEENAYDILAPVKKLWFSTDENGRVYELASDGSVTLVTETGEGETTRLLPAGASVLAATANLGKIFRLGDAAGTTGSYTSPVHDAGSVARWGRLSWRAATPKGSSLVFRTRTGNSTRPDKTWSDWSGPMPDASGSRIESPNARYVQWKVEMAGGPAATPEVNNVSLSYLPQNSPPTVKNISVINQAVPAGQSAKTSASQSTPSSAYSVTVTDTADTSATSAGTPTQVLPRGALAQIMITWQADDPDGDRLVSSVYFRAEDDTQWKLLKADLHENVFSVDADSFADGRYVFRVVVSDSEVNPPGEAKQAELASSPVLIDNTPPVVTVSSVKRDGAKARIEFQAADTASALRRCEYSVDAGRWTPVEAQDGVIDGLRESFTLETPALAAGEHLLVIRVADSAGNTGLAKVTLK